jgi:hypothetical protein
MIVGCYTLDLYCRNSAVSRKDRLHKCKGSEYDQPGQFTGYNEREAKAEAKNLGWVFSKGDVTCPWCKNDAP